jgi:hypothetical protein
MRRTSWLSTAIVVLLSVAVPATATAAGKHPHKKNERHGGKVSKAWPNDKAQTPPDNPLAQWLASQVGPVPVKTGKGDNATKHADAHPGTLARAAAVAAGNNAPEPVAFSASVTANGKSLLLVRSFDIPTTDSSYNRLANLSWTYDNALAALAFIDLGYKSQAVQLLDQLRALQRTDGSLAFAYDVNTGGESGQVRTNALAWVGIAAVSYRAKYGDSRYDGLIGGLAQYLFAERRSDGLMPGGPDVTWVSTQHNLLAAEFFRAAGEEFGSKQIGAGYTMTGTQLTAQYNTTASAITSKLLVSSGLLSSNFVQGLNDSRVPLDVQSMGAVFLANRGDLRAPFVAGYLSNFYVAPRTVGGIRWSGYKPFLGSGAPDVVWSEGTIQADWALHRLSVLSNLADAAVLVILSTTDSGQAGPAGADKAVNEANWGEFPSWPSSAAGSWLLIESGGGDALFS